MQKQVELKWYEGIMDLEKPISHVEAILSTDHAASSMGLPVLVVGGVAKGHAELPDGYWIKFGAIESEEERELWMGAHRAGFTINN